MKRILLGMILGALLGAGVVKAQYERYDNDDLMRKLESIQSTVEFVEMGVMHLHSCPCGVDE